MFPRRYCLFIFIFFFFEGGEGAESFYADRIPLADVPNPRVKCNLTALLHVSAAAAGSPLNVRYFRVYVIFMRWQWMDVQREISSAREMQINKQISAGYWRWWEIDHSIDANPLIVWRGQRDYSIKNFIGTLSSCTETSLLRYRHHLFTAAFNF